jgi:hypothetical protein
MVLLGYSGARGTLIYEKNLKPKISCQTPFNKTNWPFYSTFNKRGSTWLGLARGTSGLRFKEDCPELSAGKQSNLLIR